MKHCISCGSSISDQQTVCSMCYGDIDYGRDGYYRDWAEQEQQRIEDNGIKERHN